jgi:hypothetical protein
MTEARQSRRQYNCAHLSTECPFLKASMTRVLNLTGENSSEAMAQIAFGLECQE